MNFPIFPDKCQSMLCQFLTPEIFELLKEEQTRNGFTLEQAIRSGVENPDSSIGVYAGDAESYTLFAPLFDPIIKAYHGFEKSDHHRSDLDPAKLTAPNPDPDGRFIISTRIRVGRNIADMPLGPAITKEQRDKVESQVVSGLQTLTGDLSGAYYPLLGMTPETQAALIEDHFLFKEGDRFLESAGLNRDWPSGRGIYHNHDKTFLVWVSYLTSCPTNLGTAMRASIHIALPNLAKDRARFEEICNRHHLQIRGIHGEHSESEGGVYDISNRRRLGVTEIEAVQDMYNGAVELIAAEKSLI